MTIADGIVRATRSGLAAAGRCYGDAMIDEGSPATDPAAEAQWNRLLDAASRLFAERGEDVPLEAVAEAAGVGIGMAARHFPTRAALIEAVRTQRRFPGRPRPVARRTLFVVTMEPSEEFESRLNRWYDEEHFPERLSIPGFQGGRRYRRDADGPPKYLATYELAGPEVLDSEPYHALSTPPSEWTREVRRNTRITREVYFDVTPDLPDGPVRRRPATDF
jgi:AcrR family transcriptional regulator